MRTLYFDCFAGASGNMILGALIAIGVDREKLKQQIRLLDIADFDLEISQVDRSGIKATHIEVKVPREHIHRHLHDIEEIVNDSQLTDAVKHRAVSIFTRLAEAEAKVHGIDIRKVHFHEVGAMDAIVDVVGACIGFEMLGVEKFACSKIHVGSGFAQMEHGKFPIPPPAVAELLKGTPIYSTEIEGELITPTGAAIISTLCDNYGTIPEMIVERTAYGAGTRTYEKFPNVLRMILGNAEVRTLVRAKYASQNSTDNLLLLETNIDDLSPQILGYVMERAFEIGALDCWFTPIQMKKNRPATMVSILCEPTKREALTELLYRETTTLGVRIRQVERECVRREIITVNTEFGDVDVKIARLGSEVVNAMPEYDQVRKLAMKNNVAFRIVREAALAKLSEKEISARAEA